MKNYITEKWVRNGIKTSSVANVTTGTQLGEDYIAEI
jgi:hypothetical protein